MLTNMGKTVQMTQVGLEALNAELIQLRDEKRPALVERLSRARSEGDLSENSDYISAREELEFLDGRISELEEVVANASVVAKPVNGSGVGVGTKVTVGVNGTKLVFTIVGEWEANPAERKISPDSPLGQSLIGKQVGQRVEVEAPIGKVVYEILAIDR